MDEKEKLKDAILFLRSMAEKSKAEGKGDCSFGDGISAGREIGFSVSADYLSSLFEIGEE